MSKMIFTFRAVFLLVWNWKAGTVGMTGNEISITFCFIEGIEGFEGMA